MVIQNAGKIALNGKTAQKLLKIGNNAALKAQYEAAANALKNKAEAIPGVTLKLKSGRPNLFGPLRDYFQVNVKNAQGQTKKIALGHRGEQESVQSYLNNVVKQAKAIKELIVDFKQPASIAKSSRREEVLAGLKSKAHAQFEGNLPEKATVKIHRLPGFHTKVEVAQAPVTQQGKTAPRRFVAVKPKHADNKEFITQKAPEQILNAYERRINPNGQYTARQVEERIQAFKKVDRPHIHQQIKQTNGRLETQWVEAQESLRKGPFSKAVDGDLTGHKANVAIDSAYQKRDAILTSQKTMKTGVQKELTALEKMANNTVSRQKPSVEALKKDVTNSANRQIDKLNPKYEPRFEKRANNRTTSFISAVEKTKAQFQAESDALAQKMAKLQQRQAELGAKQSSHLAEQLQPKSKPVTRADVKEMVIPPFKGAKSVPVTVGSPKNVPSSSLPPVPPKKRPDLKIEIPSVSPQAASTPVSQVSSASTPSGLVSPASSGSSTPPLNPHSQEFKSKLLNQLDKVAQERAKKAEPVATKLEHPNLTRAKGPKGRKLPSQYQKPAVVSQQPQAPAPLPKSNLKRSPSVDEGLSDLARQAKNQEPQLVRTRSFGDIQESLSPPKTMSQNPATKPTQVEEQFALKWPEPKATGWRSYAKAIPFFGKFF